MKKRFVLLRRFLRRTFRRYDFERLLSFNYNSKVPERQITIGYLSYIVIGTLLLSLPFAQRINTPFIDNLFSITSAVSTTGLGTVVMPEHYTLFGQIIILIMIQLGGLGYMSVSSFIMYRMTHHFMGIKNKVLRAEFSLPQGIDLKSIVHSVVLFTLLFETSGTIALYFAFSAAGVDTPLWEAIFHSVSSFCTAGFSTFATGLEAFKFDKSINLIVSTLSYAGAMGFIVMTDLWKKITVKEHRITFTTKVIIFITTLITIVGSTQLFLLEPSIQSFSIGDRVMVSVFHVMSAMTTVGFNTLPLNGFAISSLMVLVFVMYIGASPSGTGGGLKSTTASAVFAFVKCKLGMQRDTTLAGHRLPSFRVESALTTFAFYTSILFLGTYLLTITDDFPLDKILFEATSALGTVGLSAGITSLLSNSGKLIIILMMFIGRIGVFTFGTAMLMRMANQLKNQQDDDIAV